MDAIDSAHHYKSDRSECTLCIDCFIHCPGHAVTISIRKEKSTVKGVTLSRRDFLVGAGTAVAGIGLLKGDVIGINPDKHLLRPPGVSDEGEFLSKCIRCGQCMRICPTAGLQPSRLDAGIGAIWTPRLMPRLGPCTYTCNACGHVCPTGAIPRLVLTIKQQTILGKAVIDQGRCLEWSENADCLICEEFCPLPEKAIERRERIEIDKKGNTIVVHGPFVFPTRCIGCGICENSCPIEGEAAIRVIRKEV